MSWSMLFGEAFVVAVVLILPGLFCFIDFVVLFCCGQWHGVFFSISRTTRLF